MSENVTGAGIKPEFEGIAHAATERSILPGPGWKAAKSPVKVTTPSFPLKVRYGPGGTDARSDETSHDIATDGVGVRSGATEGVTTARFQKVPATAPHKAPGMPHDAVTEGMEIVPSDGRLGIEKRTWSAPFVGIGTCALGCGERMANSPIGTGTIIVVTAPCSSV